MGLTRAFPTNITPGSESEVLTTYTGEVTWKLLVGSNLDPNAGIVITQTAFSPAGPDVGKVLKATGVGTVAWAVDTALTGPINPDDDGKVTIASGGDLVYLAGSAVNNVLVWNGTAWVSGTVALADPNAVTGVLSSSNGGTGLSSIGLANEVLKVNASGTALEYGKITTDNISPTAAITASQLAPGGDNTVLWSSGGVVYWTGTPILSGSLSFGTNPATGGTINTSGVTWFMARNSTSGIVSLFDYGGTVVDRMTFGSDSIPLGYVRFGSGLSLNIGATTIFSIGGSYPTVETASLRFRTAGLLVPVDVASATGHAVVVAGGNAVTAGFDGGAATLQGGVPGAGGAYGTAYVKSNTTQLQVLAAGVMYGVISSSTKWAVTAGEFAIYTPTLDFGAAVASPVFKHTETTGATTDMTILAQSTSSGAGANLKLWGGSGTTTNGAVQVGYGAITTAQFGASLSYGKVGITTIFTSNGSTSTFGDSTTGSVVLSAQGEIDFNVNSGIRRALFDSASLRFQGATYLSWDYNATVPLIQQATAPTGDGIALKIRSQGATAGAAGDLKLATGAKTTGTAYFRFYDNDTSELFIVGRAASTYTGFFAGGGAPSGFGFYANNPGQMFFAQVTQGTISLQTPNYTMGYGASTLMDFNEATTLTFRIHGRQTDNPAGSLIIYAGHALAGAVTNLVGGDVEIYGGNKATAGATTDYGKVKLATNKGNVAMFGATLYGAGAGVLSIGTVLTAPTTSSAGQALIWNESNTLKLQGHTQVQALGGAPGAWGGFTASAGATTFFTSATTILYLDNSVVSLYKPLHLYSLALGLFQHDEYPGPINTVIPPDFTIKAQNAKSGSTGAYGIGGDLLLESGNASTTGSAGDVRLRTGTSNALRVGPGTATSYASAADGYALVWDTTSGSLWAKLGAAAIAPGNPYDVLQTNAGGTATEWTAIVRHTRMGVGGVDDANVRIRVQGSGVTSATYQIASYNSAGFYSFYARDDGNVSFGGSAASDGVWFAYESGGYAVMHTSTANGLIVQALTGDAQLQAMTTGRFVYLNAPTLGGEVISRVGTGYVAVHAVGEAGVSISNNLAIRTPIEATITALFHATGDTSANYALVTRNASGVGSMYVRGDGAAQFGGAVARDPTFIAYYEETFDNAIIAQTTTATGLYIVNSYGNAILKTDGASKVTALEAVGSGGAVQMSVGPAANIAFYASEAYTSVRAAVTGTPVYLDAPTTGGTVSVRIGTGFSDITKFTNDNQELYRQLSILLDNKAGAGLRLYYWETSGTGPLFYGHKARGTEASPLDIGQYDIALSLSAYGWAGSTWNEMAHLFFRSGDTSPLLGDIATEMLLYMDRGGTAGNELALHAYPFGGEGGVYLFSYGTSYITASRITAGTGPDTNVRAYFKAEATSGGKYSLICANLAGTVNLIVPDSEQIYFGGSTQGGWDPAWQAYTYDDGLGYKESVLVSSGGDKHAIVRNAGTSKAVFLDAVGAGGYVSVRTGTGYTTSIRAVDVSAVPWLYLAEYVATPIGMGFADLTGYNLSRLNIRGGMSGYSGYQIWTENNSVDQANHFSVQDNGFVSFGGSNTEGPAFTAYITASTNVLAQAADYPSYFLNTSQNVNIETQKTSGLAQIIASGTGSPEVRHLLGASYTLIMSTSLSGVTVVNNLAVGTTLDSNIVGHFKGSGSTGSTRSLRAKNSGDYIHLDVYDNGSVVFGGNATASGIWTAYNSGGVAYLDSSSAIFLRAVSGYLALESSSTAYLRVASSVVVQATNLSTRTVSGLNYNAFITATQVPTGSGVTFVGNAGTAPSSSPVGGFLMWSTSSGNPAFLNTSGNGIEWVMSSSTSASAGTYSVPSSCVEFITITYNGNTRKIPLFAA